ncbi:hypothetical protein BSKO_04907 [Bryopsis sp. KO-2023]|nr:hypothetical protein BSKO_04907 [Bryopsis sp. KO-2023]
METAVVHRGTVQDPDRTRRFIGELGEWWRERGHRLKIPKIKGLEVDLLSLWDVVQLYGGSKEVCKSRHWADIGRLFANDPTMNSSSASYLIKRIYVKWVWPYEVHVHPERAMADENARPYYHASDLPKAPMSQVHHLEPRKLTHQQVIESIESSKLTHDKDAHPEELAVSRSLHPIFSSSVIAEDLEQPIPVLQAATNCEQDLRFGVVQHLPMRLVSAEPVDVCDDRMDAERPPSETRLNHVVQSDSESDRSKHAIHFSGLPTEGMDVRELRSWYEGQLAEICSQYDSEVEGLQDTVKSQQQQIHELKSELQAAQAQVQECRWCYSQLLESTSTSRGTGREIFTTSRATCPPEGASTG